jgi:hypothetical protein
MTARPGKVASSWRFDCFFADPARSSFTGSRAHRGKGGDQLDCTRAKPLKYMALPSGADPILACAICKVFQSGTYKASFCSGLFMVP